MYAHKTKIDRNIITLNEWAKYLSVSRHTVRKRIRDYEALGYEYDGHDVFSILNFTKYLTAKKMLS